MSNSSTPELLNPGTLMAWVPPSVAQRLALHIYLTIASCVVLLWDIIVHIPEDWKLLTHFRLNVSMLFYCISRLAGLAYALGLLVVQTAPIGDCRYLRYVNMLFIVAFPATVLLFVLRVCALHHNRRWIVAFFSLSWLAVLVSSIMLSLGTTGMIIPNTQYCIEMKDSSSYHIAAIIPLLHDTLVFLATAWAFMRNSYLESNAKNTFAIMVTGKHLPPFSRSILRNGQAYYLVTLILSLAFVTITFLPYPPVPPCYFGLPTFVLINNMTCLVYRNVRLGVYQDDFMPTAVIERELEQDGT